MSLTMNERKTIIRDLAEPYPRANIQQKGQMLEQLAEATGCKQHHAARCCDDRAGKPGVAIVPYFLTLNSASAPAISRPLASIRSRSSSGVRVSTSGFLWGFTALRS